MRSIVLFMNVSLDGYFEAPGHDLAWATHDFEAFYQRDATPVEALLFGRHTYEMMRSFWPTEQAAALMPDVAGFMNAQPKFVVTHDEHYAPGWSQVSVVSGNVPAAIGELKRQGDGTIMLFGSNTLAVTLLEHGLLDVVQVNVNPVVLGTGTALFAGLDERVGLTLRESRAFASGCVLLKYEAARG